MARQEPRPPESSNWTWNCKDAWTGGESTEPLRSAEPLPNSPFFKAGESPLVGVSFSWVELEEDQYLGLAYLNTLTTEVGSFVSSRKSRFSRSRGW